MDAEQFRAAAHKAIEQVIQYYDNVADLRVTPDVQPGYLRPLLPERPPQDGEPWEAIQEDLTSKIVPGLTHWQSPNFFAFFPANTSYPGILGDLYSSAFSCAAFNWVCAPAYTELEIIVLDWLCKLLHLPECYLSTSPNGGGGVIQGSASEAIVTCVVAARERYLRGCAEGVSDEKERERVIAQKRGNLVVLASSHTHSSTQKAAMITGTKFATVQVDSEYRLRGKALRDKLSELREQGLEPFFLTCTLGTTSTCAIDEFNEIAEVARENPQVWIHVDAAYAGAALILPEYQDLTLPFSDFDSFDMNMHKWLLVPFDASCLFVKSRKPLLDALSVSPSFLHNNFSKSGLVTDYRNWQIPLGRRFRALKIWFVMRTYGVSGMQAHLRHSISIGNIFANLIKCRGDLFEILAPPRFGLTVFRVRSEVGCVAIEGTKEKNLRSNRLTKEVYEMLNASGKIYLSSAVLGEVFSIRVVTGVPNVDKIFAQKAFQLLVQAVEKVAGLPVDNGAAKGVERGIKRPRVGNGVAKGVEREIKRPRVGNGVATEVEREIKRPRLMAGLPAGSGEGPMVGNGVANGVERELKGPLLRGL